MANRLKLNVNINTTVLVYKLLMCRLYMLLGEIVSFQPVVYYNGIYLVQIGIVAFLTQLQLLHLLRYHKTIAILGTTLAHALRDLVSFGLIMAVIFLAFTSAIYLMYHDLTNYSTMATAMGSQVGLKAYTKRAN